MFRQLRVAVVVPAFNERRAIAETVATIPDFVDTVIVVDDGSIDDTAARAAVTPEIHVIRHGENRGVGGAIATGYRHVLETDLDVAVVMGGDGQMDPGDMPALLDPIADGGADYVKGNRFLHPDVWTAMPPSRIVGNVLLSAATRVTSGYRHVFDSQCGYTAIHRDALAKIDLDVMWTRYGYPNDLLSRLNVAGVRVVDVAVRPIYGAHWKSGIHIGTALHPIPWVLLRSWGSRLAATAAARTDRCGIGVVTTSYPRFAGDAAGNFVGGHVAALRHLGHDVEVIAAGDADLAAHRPELDRPHVRIASPLFYRGGAPDALERSGSLVAAAVFTARLTLAVTRRARRWDLIIAHWLAPSALAALPARTPLLAIGHGGDVHTLARLRLLGPVLAALHARRARLAFVAEHLAAIARRHARLARAPRSSSRWASISRTSPRSAARPTDAADDPRRRAARADQGRRRRHRRDAPRPRGCAPRDRRRRSRARRARAHA